MIIKNINIISFGKLKSKKITFSDHLNVIYGKNESGKTTISSFIEAMLYSFPPRSDRAKYLPWDNSPAAGEMTVNTNGRDITFYRKFGTQPKGDVLEPKDFSLSGTIPPDRDSYRKSIYSREGKAGDFGTTSDIDAVISNLLATGDENLSIKDAVKQLEKLRRSLNSGGKLKEYENRIAHLEDEYSSAFAEEMRNEAAKAEIREKKSILQKLEKQAIETEKQADTSIQTKLKELDGELNAQAEYISRFPVSSSAPPQKPPAFTPSFIFYIICAIMLFIAGFFTHTVYCALAVLPVAIYFILFALKMAAYKSALKAFLASVYCSTLDEYEKMELEKLHATEYYNSLLKKKSDFVTETSIINNADKSIIYRKILSLKYEIESLEKAANSNLRDLMIISEELTYYKNLHSELSKKLEAIRIAIEAFYHAQTVISTDFTPKVTRTAMKYLNSIAPKEGRSVALSTDMKLSVSDPIRQDLPSQSFGFREEMYLCFRIAWSEFLFGKEFPLIFDDPFLGSDDYREKALIDLLYSLSKDRQIIIFTNRKNDYFSQLNCNWVDISPSDDV